MGRFTRFIANPPMPPPQIGNDGEEKVVGGLVEVSVVLPEEMPHFNRE